MKIFFEFSHKSEHQCQEIKDVILLQIVIIELANW